MNLFKNRPLCLATVFFVLTGFSCLLMPLGAKVALGGILLIASATLLCVRIRRKHSFTGVILLSLCTLQCLLSCLAIDLPLARAGRLEGEPHRTTAYVTEVVHSSDDYHSYTIRTILVDGSKQSLTFSMSCDTPLQIGDRFSAELSYHALDPDQIFYNSYAFAGGKHGEATAASDITVEGVKNTPFIFASKCRNFLCSVLDTRFSSDGAALLRAMLLGDRSGLSPKTSLSFERAGVTHLLALSGMHITLLSLAVRKFLNLLGLPNKVKLSVAILFVILYSLLVGMPLSILRAAGMTILLLLGGLIRRERDAVTSLSASVLIILLVSPRAILDLGFWLSVTATLGILLSLEYRIGFVKGRGFVLRLLRLLLSPLIMTVSASLFTLPITAFAFGAISLLSIPANLIFPSVLNYIIYLGLLALPIPFLRPLVNLAVDGYLGLLDIITQPRGITLSLEPVIFRILLLIIILLTVILLAARIEKPRRLLISIAALALSAVIAVGVPYIRLRCETSLTYISDENYNDYVIVKDDGYNLVYVSSYLSSYNATRLLYELYEMNIYEIDMLFISHYHSGIREYIDRIAGSVLVYEMAMPPAYSPEEGEIRKDAEQTCLEYDIPLHLLPYESTIQCGEALLTVLPRSIYDGDHHAKSAMTIDLGGHSFYYAPGGYYHSVSNVEKALEPLTCDTLIFGTHGTALDRKSVHIYPLDEHVSTVLYGYPDGSMAGDDREAEIYKRLHILREKRYTFSLD